MQKINILLLYKALDSSARLCAYVQCLDLFKRNLISFKYKKTENVKEIDLKWSDFIIIVRGDNELDVGIAKIAKKSGRKILYILDDDLLNVPKTFSCGKYYSDKVLKSNILALIEICDYFGSPSKNLLEKYGNQKTCIKIIEPSMSILDVKEKNTDNKIHIGFAGSKDRVFDVDDIIGKALMRVQEKYGDYIVIDFFGISPRISTYLKCNLIPYFTSYEEYQKKMLELNWDIGLAPMQTSCFHSCKHYNKFIEYSGFGVVGIYSNVVPYTDIIEDGVTGLLCENTEDAWFSCICRLVENNELRESIALNCIAKSKDSFSVEKSADYFYKQLELVDFSKKRHLNSFFIFFYKLKTFYNRFMSVLYRYGWKSIYIIPKKIFHKIIMK